MQRYLVLDALRGLAAIMVAIFHAKVLLSGVVAPEALNGLASFVDFFFVLSGFVLARGYVATGFHADAFAWRRLARLMPMHVWALLVILVLEAGKVVALAWTTVHFKRLPFEGMGLESFLDNLFLLQVTGLLGDRISWNMPAWSLSAELGANLIVAGLAAGMLRRHLVPVLAVVVGAAAVAFGLGLVPHVDYGPAALVRCLYGFGAGLLLHWSIRDGKSTMAASLANVLEVLGVVAIIVAVTVLPPAATMLACPLFAFAIVVFAREAGCISRALLRSRADWLGTISYSIYLNHIALLVVIERLASALQGQAGSPLLRSAAIMAVYLGALVVYSAMTYRWIELPGQRFLLGLKARQKARSMPARAAVDGGHT